MKHWAAWLVVGGLAIDLIDSFTTTAGSSAGVFYGPGGLFGSGGTIGGFSPIASLEAAVPSIHLGEIIAMIGLSVLIFEKKFAV